MKSLRQSRKPEISYVSLLHDGGWFKNFGILDTTTPLCNCATSDENYLCERGSCSRDALFVQQLCPKLRPKMNLSTILIEEYPLIGWTMTECQSSEGYRQIWGRQGEEIWTRNRPNQQIFNTQASLLSLPLFLSLLGIEQALLSLHIYLVLSLQFLLSSRLHRFFNEGKKCLTDFQISSTSASIRRRSQEIHSHMVKTSKLNQDPMT